MNNPEFLDTIIGNVFSVPGTPPMPTEYWVGLSSTEPTLTGGNITEPPTVGSGYELIKLTNLSTSGDGLVTNNDAVSFNESTSDWGVQRYYFVRDAKTGGKYLYGDALSSARSIEIGTVLMFKPGELKVRLRNPVVTP